VILKDYKGFLQADAANVFDGFYRPGDIVEVGCWAHARPYFHEARSSDAALAAESLARIGFFYDIEREAKKLIVVLCPGREFSETVGVIPPANEQGPHVVALPRVRKARPRPSVWARDEATKNEFSER
jgi:hypothetical protein